MEPRSSPEVESDQQFVALPISPLESGILGLDLTTRGSWLTLLFCVSHMVSVDYYLVVIEVWIYDK